MIEIGQHIARPDGSYWFRDRSGWAVVKDGKIVDIVRVWAGWLLYRTAKEREQSR